MATIKNDIKCPKCNKKNRIKMHEVVTSDEIDKLVTRELFMITCKDCGEKISVEYPLKVIGSNYQIFYTPMEDKPIKDNSYEINRVCDTFDDLKEKVLILEDNLNDIVIEFIKKFLASQLDEEMKKELKDVRYDGISENNLIFYLVGVNKSICCTRLFYEAILSKSKIKKIRKSVMIDSNTYDSYFKMRMI